MFFEPIYIKILNWTYKRTQKITEKGRNAIIHILTGMIVTSILISHSMKYMGFIYPETLKCGLGALLMGLIIVFSVNQPLNKVEWNRLLIYGIIACGTIMFITGLLHYIGYSYMMLGLIMAIEFPALFFVWLNRRDYETLYTIIARVICLAAIIYMIVCMISAPIGADNTFSVAGRYAGTTSNPNTIGMIGVAFAAAGIYIAFQENIRGFSIIGALSFGVAVAFIDMSASRTGMLALFAMMVAGSILLISAFVKHRKISSKRVITIAMFVVVIIITQRYCPLLFEINSSNELEENPYSSQLYVEHVDMEEDQSVAEARLEKGADEENNIDINHMSSGRIELWKAYLTRLNLFGNDMNNKVRYGYGSDTEIQYAHNTSLEYAYRSGIIVGGIFLIFEIITAAWTLQLVFSVKRRQKYSLFCIMSTIGFGVISLLDVAVMPFSSLPLLMYWIGVAPLFDKDAFSHQTDGERT